MKNLQLFTFIATIVCCTNLITHCQNNELDSVVLNNEQSLDTIENLENRFVQISVLPFFGTNFASNENIVHNLSINLIAGITQHVHGVELGGMLNLTRQNMYGVQAAGFGNVVNGQIRGVQIAGFGNTALKEVVGAQIAGFGNVTKENVNGAQIAGFGNYASDIDGIQVAGFSSVATQIQGFQVAGFINQTQKINGAQIAGFLNKTEEIKGVQIAGFLNLSKKVNGLQIAPFNICDTIEKGAVIGVFNWVKNGVPHFEIESNDMFHTQVNIKSGNEYFYQFTSVGFRMNGTDSRWGFGLGFGTQKKLTKRTYTSLELLGMTNHAVEKFDFESGVSADLRLNFGIKFGKGNQSLNIGPILHTYFLREDLTQSVSDVSSNSATDKILYWPGYRLGLWF